jgi:hypothetical protein
MKTITLTAEEIRMLELQLWANPCQAGCVLGRPPRLPKLDNGTANCFALNKKGEYICPLQRTLHSIENKLGLCHAERK